jgi:(R,R)-butanediol dehydrogenase/meso-butanediol dehydrogenase/diacetyl reductase
VRAAVLGSRGDLRVEQVSDPVPDRGQLVIQVTACGICGSDLKARSAMPHGTVMGHEFCGEVVALGKGVGDPWRVGTSAAVLPVLSCGVCSWCLAGEVAHCESARLIGLGGSPGGFAEFVAVSADLSFALPQGLPPSLGALVEPFAVGLHTARVGSICDGDSVLVIGAGPVGLTTAKWAQVLGARDVVVSDPVAARRELSGNFGATRVVDPATDELGDGYDVVIDCVGKPGLLDHCVAATRTKGRVVVAGVCVEPDPYFPAMALMKELTVAFSVYYRPDEFRSVIDAFMTGQIDPIPLVTRNVPLDQVDAAFDSLIGSVVDSKILVDPTVRS